MPHTFDYQALQTELVGADRSEPPTYGQVLHCKPETLSNPGQLLTSWTNVAGDRAPLTSTEQRAPMVVDSSWGQFSAARFGGSQNGINQGQFLAYDKAIKTRSFSFFAVIWRAGAASSFPVQSEALLSGFAGGNNYFVCQFPNSLAAPTSTNASSFALYSGSGYIYPNPPLRVQMRPTLVGLVSRPVGGATWICNDQISTSVSPIDVTLPNVAIGGQYTRDGQFGLFGDLFEVMMYDRAISDREISRIVSYFALKYGIDPQHDQTVFVGNSLTAGYRVKANEAWPQLIARNLKGAAFNEGITALSQPDMTTGASLVADRWNSTANYSRQTLFVWEGTNDLKAGATGGNYTGYAGQVQTNLQNFCIARRAAGWRVVVLTLLPRVGDLTAGAQTANFETARLQVNAWMRTNWSNFADALVDVAGLPFAADSTQVALGSTSGYWHDDKVHLNAAGHRAVADLAISVLRPLDLLKKGM